MPYCEEHNEVYRAEECPVCAGEDHAEAAAGPVGSSGGSGSSESSGPVEGGVSELASDIVDAVTSDDGSVDGDAVVGSQEKTVERTDVTNIDRSNEIRDESREVHAESTTVSDSIVKDSEVGSGEGNTEVDDSVVSNSSIGSDRDSTIDAGRGRPGASRPESGSDPETAGRREPTSDHDPDPTAGQTSGEELDSGEGTQFCISCGEEVPARAAHCPACGEEL